MKIHPSFSLLGAGPLESPLLLDSPHSGTAFPDDLPLTCPKDWLRQTEDIYVDELMAGAADHGIPLLKAHFSRSYIDVNRAEDDIDPTILAESYPLPLNPSERSLVGHGLVRHLCRGRPVYAEKIPVAVVTARIANCYRPYHAAFKALAESVRVRHGAVWHINCHSMASSDNQGLSRISEMFGRPRPDFVLGDRDGTTCDPVFTRIVGQFLATKGYSIAYNDPYKGMEMLTRYGRPAQNFHSLQIEINRKLYVNEDTFVRMPGFTRLQQDLSEMLAMLKVWTVARGQKMAAE
jgi:N-formylglutamate amidohydrolase